MTSGSLRELMNEQVLEEFWSCHVVGVTQQNASRIGRCKGTPIRSGISSELATELLPAFPGRLIKLQNRRSEWRNVDNAPRAGTTVTPFYPKGPFRTKNTTMIVKIVNYYAVVILLRPPNFLRREPFFERNNVCNSQENGVRGRCTAIVNHPAVLKILRIVNLLRVLF